MIADWIKFGDVFHTLSVAVGEDEAKITLLRRYHAGLLVARITRLVSETEVDIFNVDLESLNAERQKSATQWAPYVAYKEPKFHYSASDNVVLDKDCFPQWFTWNHLRAPPDIWSAVQFNHSYRANWSGGEFATRYYHRHPQSERDSGDFTDTIAAGVMLRADLVNIIPEAGASEAYTQEATKNEGGRPAQRHGDVIAAVTLQLVDRPQNEQRRYTAASLSKDLIEAYKSIGENAPSARNAELYAAGILRVIRARKTPLS